MADLITDAVFLDNGWLLSRGRFQTFDVIREVFQNHRFVTNFHILKGGLTPSTSYEVKLVSFEVEKYLHDSGTPAGEWESISFPDNQIYYTWNVTSDTGGAITDIVTPTNLGFTQRHINTAIDVLKKSQGAPISSYQWGEPNSPFPPDPTERMKSETDAYGNIFQLDCGITYGIRDVMAINRVARYGLRIYRNGEIDEISYVTGLYTFATAVDTTDSDNPSNNTLPEVTIPVDFDAPDSVWSPSVFNTTVDRAVIPYNKTTEREVVHLDYRIKSDEIVQPSINSVIVPYITDDASLFKISSAGGSTFPISGVVENGDGTTTLTSSSDLAGTYHVGLEYGMRYELGNIVIKPGNGDGKTRSVNRSTKDTLSTMTFAYSDASVFDVEISAPKRDVRLAQFVSDQIGYSYIGEADLRTGEFRFHVKGKTRDTKIAVTDNSVFPLQLQHIEIERNVTSRSKR